MGSKARPQHGALQDESQVATAVGFFGLGCLGAWIGGKAYWANRVNLAAQTEAVDSALENAAIQTSRNLAGVLRLLPDDVLPRQFLKHRLQVLMKISPGGSVTEQGGNIYGIRSEYLRDRVFVCGPNALRVS